MVKITNGAVVFEVTNGAFETIYKRQGFTRVAEPTPEVANAAANVPSEDDQFVADLLEKPIAQWTKGEVKRFAELKGIDITGTKNVGEAKNLIKEALEIEGGAEDQE